MKRTGLIACLSCMFIMLFSMSAFAAGFSVVETTPEDGQKGTAQENMGVKVTFSDAVYEPDNEAANAKCCHLTDPKGKEVKSRVVPSKQDPDLMLVLADVDKPTDIKGATEYTLTIDKGFKSAAGDTLKEDFKVSFTTLDPKNSMIVSMLMMVVMMVVMVVFTKRSLDDNSDQKKKEKEKEKKAEAKPQKFNPYKIAKETGKSVEEVIAEEKRKQEKRDARVRRQEAKDAKVEARKERYREEYRKKHNDNLKVAGPAPISKYSSYKADK